MTTHFICGKSRQCVHRNIHFFGEQGLSCGLQVASYGFEFCLPSSVALAYVVPGFGATGGCFPAMTNRKPPSPPVVLHLFIKKDQARTYTCI
jgi:hypothetical protein